MNMCEETYMEELPGETKKLKRFRDWISLFITAHYWETNVCVSSTNFIFSVNGDSNDQMTFLYALLLKGCTSSAPLLWGPSVQHTNFWKTSSNYIQDTKLKRAFGEKSNTDISILIE